MLKKLAAKERTRSADINLGIILAFVAGALNAGGFLVVGYYTSHMTGVASSIADLIVINRFELAFISFLFMLSFICGAASSAVIINWARSRGFASEYALPILIEAILLLLFGLISGPGDIVPAVNTTICLLCFTMGLQNAMITKISNAEIRTTHVTGLTTDIGIECGRYIFSLFHGKQGVTLRPERLRVHVSLLVSFIAGGLAGAYAFHQAGMIAVIPLAFVLMLVAAMPVLDDLKRG